MFIHIVIDNHNHDNICNIYCQVYIDYIDTCYYIYTHDMKCILYAMNLDMYIHTKQCGPTTKCLPLFWGKISSLTTSTECDVLVVLR